MPSRFERLRDADLRPPHAFALLAVVVAAFILRWPGGVLADPFHQGEYFAALATWLAPQVGETPYTLHGALDYAPAWLALQWAGPQDHFFGTWLIYRLLEALAVLLVFLVAREFLRDRAWRLPLLALVTLLASLCVGYRDVLLLLALWLYFLVQRLPTPAWRVAANVALGVVAAFGIFWSFDRGIIAVVALGSACLLQAGLRRRQVPALAAFVAALPLLMLSSPWYDPQLYLDNLRFLFETSAQWRYPWGPRTVALALFLVAVNAVALAWMLMALHARWRQGLSMGGVVVDALALALLALLMLKASINRVDLPHVAMACWAPALIALYVYGRVGAPALPRIAYLPLVLLLVFPLVAGFRLQAALPALWLLLLVLLFCAWPVDSPRRADWTARLVGLGLLLPLLAALHAGMTGLVAGDYRWLGYVANPPGNAALATPGVRWAADELRAAGAGCVFDFSNGGVINGLSGLPACTRYTYPVYATRAQEAEMIDALRERRPAAVVYSAENAFYRIDGRTMPERFPALDAWLRTNWPRETCAQGYCIRYPGDKDHG